jgi:hypothetical protein
MRETLYCMEKAAEKAEEKNKHAIMSSVKR